MARSIGQGIIPLDPKIERTLQSLRKINRNFSSEFTMADDPPVVQHARNANILQAYGQQPRNEGQQSQNEPQTL